MADPMAQHVFDPRGLLRLQHLFHSCWDDVLRDASSSLNASNESWLRQMIAKRILGEAGRGEDDEQVLRRKALFGILGPAQTSNDNG